MCIYVCVYTLIIVYSTILSDILIVPTKWNLDSIKIRPNYSHYTLTFLTAGGPSAPRAKLFPRMTFIGTNAEVKLKIRDTKRNDFMANCGIGGLGIGRGDYRKKEGKKEGGKTSSTSSLTYLRIHWGLKLLTLLTYNKSRVKVRLPKGHYKRSSLHPYNEWIWLCLWWWL